MRDGQFLGTSLSRPRKTSAEQFFPGEKKTSGIEISSLRQGFESSVKEIGPRKLLGIAGTCFGIAGTSFNRQIGNAGT
jgi:hypothetical protein